jgi:hypothetical protein
MLASAIITRAQTILQDDTGVRWTINELLGWLNDGQREIVLLRPGVNPHTASMQLAAGTLQALPSDAVALIDVTRNLGVNGATPGPAIRRAAKEALDAQWPVWHSDQTTRFGFPRGTVIHFTHDPASPRTFHVYPPQPAADRHHVEVVYSRCPVEAATTGSNIGLNDIFSGMLLDYILYRAYSKEMDHAGAAGRAAAHYQQFINAINGMVA